MVAGWVFRILMAVVVFLSGIACYLRLGSGRLAAETFQGSGEDIYCVLGVRNGGVYAKYQILTFGNGQTATVGVGKIVKFPNALASIRSNKDGLVEYRMDDVVVATLDLKTRAFAPYGPRPESNLTSPAPF
jgi:hypothetical protein